MQHRVAEEVPLRFRSREHAGAELARALVRVPFDFVLAIPRGGVPVAAEIARAHGADLDVLVAKKVGAPGNAELAVGAVTAGGTRVRNEDVLALTGAPEAWVNRAFVRAQESASAKEARLRAGRAPLDVGGRHVLLVDDGLATGATALCCARELRARGAARVTLAVPVGSRAACALLAREVDEVVCLRQPADFAAVGEHYDDFTQVSDDEATAILMSATRA
jgi:putative phosphoribosyl transferase